MAATISLVVKVLLAAACLVYGVAEQTEVEEREVDLKFAVELTDEKWQQIKEGQWIIGIFHRLNEESVQLVKEWDLFALHCKEHNIAVGFVDAEQSFVLQVRFMVTDFPRIFFLNQSEVYVFKTCKKEALLDFVDKNETENLERVEFLWDPFSAHIAIFATVCSYGLKFYLWESGIVQKFVSSTMLTNAVFFCTIMICGTVMTLAVTILLMFVRYFVVDPIMNCISCQFARNLLTQKSSSGTASKKKHFSQRVPNSNSANLRKRK